MASTYFTVDSLISAIKKGLVYDGFLQEQFHFNSEMQDHAINLESVIFENGVFIKQYKSSKVIKFRKCTFNSLFQLDESCDLEVVYFIDCKFNSDCLISSSKIANLIFIENYCKYGLHSHRLACNSCQISLITSSNAQFTFHKASIKTCMISKLRDASDIIFTSRDWNDVEPGESIIGSLSYNADSQFSGSLTIYGPRVDVLTLSGFNKNGRLTLLCQILNINNFLINRLSGGCLARM